VNTLIETLEDVNKNLLKLTDNKLEKLRDFKVLDEEKKVAEVQKPP
jgi:hypothetical protein